MIGLIFFVFFLIVVFLVDFILLLDLFWFWLGIVNELGVGVVGFDWLVVLDWDSVEVIVLVEVEVVMVFEINVLIWKICFSICLKYF